MTQPENPNFLRGSVTEQLTSCLTGYNLAKQVNLLLISKGAESKPVKQLVNQTVILPLCEVSESQASIKHLLSYALYYECSLTQLKMSK